MIAIDPGTSAKGKGCACALFRGDTLTATYYARPAAWAHLPVVGMVVVEKPQIDKRTHASAPAVLELAWQGALVAGALVGRDRATLMALTPAQWKGSTPKPVCHHRVWVTLSQAERKTLGGDATARAIDAAVERGALDRWGKAGAAYCVGYDHNIMDAVCLGVHAR